MKKLIAFCLVLSLLFLSCGCEFSIEEKEEKAFNESVDSFFDAVDKKDADAVYNMFAENVRNLDSDLKNDIDKLISVYSGPTDQIGNDGLLQSSATLGENYSRKVSNVCPIRSGNTYYIVYFEIVWDAENEDTIGIKQISFYTVDEYYLTDTVNISSGMNVYTEKTVDKDLRCINGIIVEYFETDKTLDIKEVKKFFKDSRSLSSFTKAFGEPNASFEDWEYYYALPDNKHLVLSINNDEGETIYYAAVVDFYHETGTIYGNNNVK